MKNMKKTLTTFAVVMLFAIPVRAQVFIINAEETNRADTDPSSVPFVPANGGFSNDQGYVPVGSGAALLIGFGAAYLLRKNIRK